KRVGDYAAGTLVVREGDRRNAERGFSLGLAPLTGAGDAGLPAGGGVRDGAAGPVLSPADATLVRDFLLRREQLDPEARERLGTRLADVLAGRYGMQAARAGTRGEDFLERLAER